MQCVVVRNGEPLPQRLAGMGLDLLAMLNDYAGGPGAAALRKTPFVAHVGNLHPDVDASRARRRQGRRDLLEGKWPLRDLAAPDVAS
jgi:hypothetical protein